MWAKTVTLGALAMGCVQMAAANVIPRGDNFPVADLTISKLAASVQNTYCHDTFNQPGQTFDDQKLLYALGNGIDEQRANIYHSDSLGIVVGLQGTNLSALQSLLLNTEVFQIPANNEFGLGSDAWVYLGYYEAFKPLWPDAKKALSSLVLKYPEAKINVAGHSLGAGYGTLFALAIEHAFPGKIANVALFGIVRSGNPAFADQFTNIFKGRYVGVINGEDFVPDSPPPFLNFKQASPVILIKPANSSSYHYYENGEDPELLTRKVRLLDPSEKFGLYWGDHQGVYFHTKIGIDIEGPCPAQVGGF